MDPFPLEADGAEAEAEGALNPGAYYRELCHRLIMSHELERRGLREEMVERLIQKFAGFSMELGRVEKVVEKSSVHLLVLINALRTSSAKIAEEAHLFCRKLYPAIVEELGLLEAIRSECFAFQQREGIDVEFRSWGAAPDVPDDVAVSVYRLVQEALRNVIKHTCANKVTIAAGQRNGMLYLSIGDNGGGCDLSEVKRKKGLGLMVMQERVALPGGVLKLTAKASGGLQIAVRIPLNGGRPRERAMAGETADCSEAHRHTCRCVVADVKVQ